MNNTISISAGMPQLSETRKERLEHFALLVSIMPWFNPDILHKLYVNIFEVILPEHNGYYKRIATCADLIHSPFVERIDTNVFEIENTVKTELRDQMLESSLNQNSTTVHSTTVWIAEFMHVYAKTNQHHFLSLKYIESFKVEANLLINPNAETKRIAESLSNKIADIRSVGELKKTIRYYRKFLDNDKNQNSQLLNVLKGIEEYEEGSGKIPEGFKRIEKGSQESSIYNFKLPKQYQEQIAKHINEQSAKSLHLLINNLDGNQKISDIIIEKINNQENTESTDLKNCDFQINIFNNTIYFSLPENNYRPLNEQLDLNTKNLDGIIGPKATSHINDYLEYTLPYFRNWNYLYNLDNVNSQIEYKPIRIEYKGKEEWIESNSEAIIFENDEYLKGENRLPSKQYQTKITNISDQVIYVCVISMYSDQNYDSNVFNDIVIELHPGDYRHFYDHRSSSEAYIKLEPYEILYNWEFEFVYYKFIFSTSKKLTNLSENSFFHQRRIELPLLLTPTRGTKQSIEKGWIGNVINKYINDLENWGTHKTTIRLKNPDYNKIPKEIEDNLEAYKTNKTIFPFLEKLYSKLGEQKQDSVALNIFINNIDEHSNIENSIQNHLEKFEGVLIVDEGECDFKLNIFNNTIYYSLPEEDYRPLNEQLDLNTKNPDGIIGPKATSIIDSYLDLTLPYFENWNYINQLKNNDSKLEEKTLLIDVRASGDENWIESNEDNVFLVEVKSNESEFEDEIRLECDIQLTNQSNESLFIYVMFLQPDLAIFDVPFGTEVFQLEPGLSKTLRNFNLSEAHHTIMHEYKKIYNWKEDFCHLKFICSNSKDLSSYITSNHIKQSKLTHPLTLEQEQSKLSQHILVDYFDNIQVDWSTHKTTIKLKNPNYDIVPDELKNNWEAYYNNKTIFPFLEKLYPQIESIKTKTLYALFVGIDDYGVSNLESLRACKKDVQHFQEFLNANKNEATNFSFTTLEDREATRENIVQAIVEINAKITEDDTFFFYYAGYGLEEQIMVDQNQQQTNAQITQSVNHKASNSLKCFSGTNHPLTSICIEEIQKLANSNLSNGEVSQHKKIMVFDCNFNDNPNRRLKGEPYLKDRNILHGAIDTERTLDFTFGGIVDNVNADEAFTNGVSIYAGDKSNVEETEEFGIFTNALIHHLTEGSKTTYGEIQESLQNEKYAQKKLPYGERLRFPYVQYSNSMKNMKSERFLEEFLQTPLDEASKRIKDARDDNRKELDLSDLELDAIPAEVFELKNLKTLDISSNKLKHIPDGIGQLKNLEKLIAFENNFSARDAISLQIGQLEKLTLLLLYKCQLSIFPKGILHLKNLKNLQLEGNEIKFIPVALKEIESLINIDLRNNPILNLPKESDESTTLSSHYLKGYWDEFKPKAANENTSVLLVGLDYGNKSSYIKDELGTIEDILLSKSINVTKVYNPDCAQLSSLLYENQNQIDILHIAAYEYDTIEIEDENKNRYILNEEEFTEMFDCIKPKKWNVKLLFMNTNYSGKYCDLLSQQHFDLAIGNPEEVLDQDAFYFSIAFYEALIDNKNIEEAFEIAQGEDSHSHPLSDKIDSDGDLDDDLDYGGSYEH